MEVFAVCLQFIFRQENDWNQILWWAWMNNEWTFWHVKRPVSFMRIWVLETNKSLQIWQKEFSIRPLPPGWSYQHEQVTCTLCHIVLQRPLSVPSGCIKYRHLNVKHCPGFSLHAQSASHSLTRGHFCLKTWSEKKALITFNSFSWMNLSYCIKCKLNHLLVAHYFAMCASTSSLKAYCWST